jgi:hypothetical protein
MQRRRICWPDPDATCLEGGCIHCNDHRFRKLDDIRDYASRAGMVPNRAEGEQDAWAAYQWGLAHGFVNAEVE